MTIATYADLQAAVLSWSKRPDMSGQVPDFIMLAEKRIERDLKTFRQEKTYGFSTVIGTSTYSLPTDAVRMTRVYWTDTNGCQYPMDEFDASLMTPYVADWPQTYAIEAGLMTVYPTPAAVRPITIVYRPQVSPLASNTTNVVLTNHPNIYLFGALAELFTFARQAEMTQLYEGRYAQSVQTANKADNFKGQALLAVDAGLRTNRFNIYAGDR